MKTAFLDAGNRGPTRRRKDLGGEDAQPLFLRKVKIFFVIQEECYNKFCAGV
jgi:hypothetical protein